MATDRHREDDLKSGTREALVKLAAQIIARNGGCTDSAPRSKDILCDTIISSVATTKLSVREYLTDRGASPFREWLAELDVTVRARIQA